MQGRRVAVTGIGVVARAGIGADAFWDGLLGEAPVGWREIENWDPSPYFDNPKDARRSDPCTQYALAAAEQALEMAGELTADPARRATFVGTGVGGIGTLEDQIEVRLGKGERRVSPFLVPMMMANAPAAAISMKYGWQGPCENTVTACAAGTHAIGNAARMIADGRADVVIAGGAEAPLTPTAIAGFSNMTALSNSGVSRPFDVDRDGFTIAEGGGILVLEEWDMAVERGATIYAEIMGSASTADAHHITAPAPDGSGAVSCMLIAMEDAGITPDQVGHINAHGTSTDKNDAAEAAAIAKVFGSNGGPLVTSTKGVTGHALGAAGALEAIAVVLAMRNKQVPPTAGLENIDPEIPALNFVKGGAADWEPAPSLSNSFGFGGHNGTIVIGPGQ